MPTFRPYQLTPGQHLQIEVVQANGARAIVTGKLDSIPVLAGTEIMRIRVVAAEVRALPAEQ